MNEPVPLYHGTEDPFPVRGSFQPIDLGPNSDNEDAESWLVAPTPRAGSFCSQYWAPGTKSVYDDDLSPTMSRRSSLAGDAFPPLAQSPDPNLGGTPNSVRSTARQQGLRSSTSRIPRPTGGPTPTPTRANDPMRQSMPTFPTTRKPGVPYRPSGRPYGGGPPSTSNSAAHRNLAARQAELRASIARQNEIRASLGRGTPVSSPSPASSASPGAGTRGARTPGAPAHGTMRAPQPSSVQPKGAAQGERAPGSRIGSGAAPSGGSYAARLAHTPNARVPSGGAPRTPATAPPATRASSEPHQEQELASPASPTPQTPPPASLPTPNKLSPQLSAAGDTKTHSDAHPGMEEEELKSANSGGAAEEQQQQEQQQQEQQQQQQEGQQQEVPRRGSTREGGGDAGVEQEQEQQHHHQQTPSIQVQETEAAATATKPVTPPPSHEGSAHRGNLGGFSALSGQRLEVVDEQQVQPVVGGAGAQASLTSTPKAGQAASMRSNSKGRTELSSPPSNSARLHGVSGTSLSHEMVTTPPMDSASEATQDGDMAQASTLVHVGETAKSLSIRGQTSLTSPSLSPQDWDASTTRSVAPMSETQQAQPQPQAKSSGGASPQGAPPAPKKKKSPQPQCCSVM